MVLIKIVYYAIPQFNFGSILHRNTCSTNYTLSQTGSSLSTPPKGYMPKMDYCEYLMKGKFIYRYGQDQGTNKK